MLKSFFLKPQLASSSRSLASIVEQDDGYIVIEEEIPRQFKSQEEFERFESTLDSTANAMTSQFAVTFVINLLLNGVMSQLWNIFNTLQIIMALPMLQVMMPGNVTHV